MNTPEDYDRYLHHVRVGYEQGYFYHPHRPLEQDGKSIPPMLAALIGMKQVTFDWARGLMDKTNEEIDQILLQRLVRHDLTPIPVTGDTLRGFYRAAEEWIYELYKAQYVHLAQLIERGRHKHDWWINGAALATELVPSENLELAIAGGHMGQALGTLKNAGIRIMNSLVYHPLTSQPAVLVDTLIDLQKKGWSLWDVTSWLLRPPSIVPYSLRGDIYRQIRDKKNQQRRTQKGL